METGKWIIVILIIAIVAGVIGYVVKPTPTPPEIAELQDRISELETTVSGQNARISELEAMPKAKLVKAGFIYVGPIGDVGWTFAHDRGRLIVDAKYDWLETVYAEGVAEADVSDVIDTMFEAGADVIFTTSFGYGWDTVTAGGRWPDKILYHSTGDSSIMGSAPNVGFYYSNLFHTHYLTGLMAGALTQTNKLGYVIAFEYADLIGRVNAFYLGAKEVNPDVEMKVIVMGTAWYDPGTATTAFNTLVDWGADVVADEEDSPAVQIAAQTLYEETDQRVWTFSKYTPMKEFGPDVILSGLLARWEKWYEYLLLKAQQGEVENWQHWGITPGVHVDIGATWDEPIRTDVIDDLKAVEVTDPALGTINVYDLIWKRYEQLSESPTSFHPFMGPIYDTEGNLRVRSGEIISADEVNWTIDWYVRGIIPP